MGNIFEIQENYKFLIVESNFKVYAFTDSELEKKILSFILEIEYIFPGLIVGHITRSSVRKLFKRGIGYQKVINRSFIEILDITIYEYARS
jgi:transcription initiation factor TFIIH subunit 4